MQICLLIVLVAVLLASADFSLMLPLSTTELLNTNQVMLVNVNNCFINSQILPNESPCAILELARRSYAEERQCNPVLATLFIPPARLFSQKPKILLISREQKAFIKFALLDIPTAESHQIHFSDFSYATNITGESFTSIFSLFRLNDELVGFAYDYTNSHMYFLIKNGERLFCSVYLINFVEDRSSMTRATFLYKVEVNSNFSSAKWSSNPYRKMFYYQKEVLEKQEVYTDIYAISYPEFIISLKNGYPGVRVSRLHSSRLSVQITDNLIYVIRPDNVPLFLTLNEPALLEACQPEERPLQHHNNYVLAITGWEYCKLRDGAAANQTKCLSERRTHTDYISKFEIKWHYILIVTLVLFLSALIVVLLYIRCRISGSKGIQNHNKFSSFMLSQDSDSFDNTL